MNWKDLATLLFPNGYRIQEDNSNLMGEATVGNKTVTVIGVANQAQVGVDICLQHATVILNTIQYHPGQGIVILVDSLGQFLSHRDELLGLNRYMAHLAKCLHLARTKGHKTVGLVYGEAVSGGFLASGMMADECYALEAANIRVMALPAMARVTKIPQETLVELSKSNPVFAPGSSNYYKMGAIEEVWSLQDDLGLKLKKAFERPIQQDKRNMLGIERGGRKLAYPVVERVLTENT